MKTIWRAVLATLLALVGVQARADEIHLSHFGEVMPSIPFAVALEQNLFQKHGVNVDDVISSTGGGTTLRNMQAGGLGFGEVAAGATITGIRAGMKVKIVGAGSESAGDYSWVVPNASPIHSVKELKGHKFGTTTPGGATYVYGELLLQQNGLADSDLTRVTVGTGAAIAALDSGTLDSAYVLEPLLSQNVGKYRILANAADVMPRVATLLLVATQDFIDKHPDQLRAIMATYKDAVDRVYANPAEAARVAMPRMVGVDQKALTLATERMAKIHYWSDGHIDPQAMANLGKLLQMTGEVPGPVDFGPMIDARFIAQ